MESYPRLFGAGPGHVNQNRIGFHTVTLWYSGGTLIDCHTLTLWYSGGTSIDCHTLILWYSGGTLIAKSIFA